MEGVSVLASDCRLGSEFVALRKHGLAFVCDSITAWCSGIAAGLDHANSGDCYKRILGSALYHIDKEAILCT